MTWQNIKRWRNQLIFVAEVMQFFPKQVLRSQLSQEYIQLGQLSRKRRSMNHARDLFPYFHTVGWQTRVFFPVNIGTCTLQVWTWLYAGNGCFLLLTFSNFETLELNAPLWDFIIRGCSFWPIQGKYSLPFAWSLCTALPPSKFQQRPWRQQRVEL